MSDSQGSGAPSTFTNFAMMVFLAVVLIGGTWFLIRKPLMWGSFYVSFYLFKAYMYAPFLMTANEYKELVGAYTAIPTLKPSQYGFWSLMTMFKIHGYVGRWVAIPLLLYWGWTTRKGVVRFKYRKPIKDVYELIDIQAKHFPASAIIKGKNLLDTHPYVGPWRTFALPLDFALDNKLLWISKSALAPDDPVDEERMICQPAFTPDAKTKNFREKRKMMPHYRHVAFSIKRANDAFSAQMGRLWEGTDKLPPLERALYAAFCAQASGDQKACIKMIEQLAFSWKEATYNSKGKITTPHYADTSGTDEMLKKFGSHKEIIAIQNRHAYAVNVITSTLALARKKGRLMHANFLWLRPVNNTLWYSLSGQGGQSAYWEANGPWAHGQIEQLMGKRIVTPIVIGAIESLRDLLSKEHWIEPGEYSEEAQKRRVKEANAMLDAEREKRNKGGRPGGMQLPQQRQPQQPPKPAAATKRTTGDEEP